MAHSIKRPVNLSLDADIVERAEKLDINLSEIAETAIRAAVRSGTAEQWRADNRAAIEDYNEMAEKHDILSDRVKGWWNSADGAV